MLRPARLLRGLIVLSVCATMWVSMGCTYFKYRGQDALEMIDLGVSITTTPQVGLYWNSLDILVFGYAKLDGQFVGIGGNQVGVTPMHVNAWGFLWGYQEIGWGDEYDVTDAQTLYIDSGGIPGFITSAIPSFQPKNIPAYTPACVHFFPHIAYVGLVWNARWYEILDFVVGFTTVDLANDDGARIGSWPWRTEPQWGGD